MAKKQKRIDDPAQRSLFEMLAGVTGGSDPAPITPGRMNVRDHLRDSIIEAIKKSRLSRWEIAGEMSHLLDQEVSKYQLDSWTAESKDGYRFPAEYLPAFCEAVGCTAPLKLLGQALGVFVMPGEEALRAEIQKYDENIKALQAEKRKRLVFLGELEGADDD